MKSLTKQIEELMPEERNTYDFGVQDPAYAEQEGFNQARTEMINKIPEILSLIRGEVEELTWCHWDIGVNEIEKGIKYIKVDDLLEKLK